MSHGDVTHEQFVDAANRFYTFVPHYFKRGQAPPLIDSLERIKV